MKTRITLIPLFWVFAHCAQLPQQDDSADLAAQELNKLSLYQAESTTLPGAAPAFPSPYLQPGENLLINGSFELPVLDTGWSVFATGQVPGWQAKWVDATCLTAPQIELQSKDLFGLDADFNQYAELDTNGACTEDARITLSQDFVSQQNHIYQLSFRMRARDAEHAMGLRVAIASGFTTDLTPAADSWQQITLFFEATAPVTTIAFTDTGAGDTFGTFIDAVEVREITVDTESMPKPEKGGRPSRGKKRESFEGGRRHRDCNRGHR